jgi:hypothetical protein
MRSWKKGRLLKSIFDGRVTSRNRGVTASEQSATGPCLPLQPHATMDHDLRCEIISAYRQVLEQSSSSVESASKLPYPKDTISQAIYEEVHENPESTLRNYLEIAFAQLELFLPPQEYGTIQEFKCVFELAQQTASSGNPVDIIKSLQMLKETEGEEAVSIQESISEKMRFRLAQIQSAPFSILDAGL